MQFLELFVIPKHEFLKDFGKIFAFIGHGVVPDDRLGLLSFLFIQLHDLLWASQLLMQEMSKFMGYIGCVPGVDCLICVAGEANCIGIILIAPLDNVVVPDDQRPTLIMEAGQQRLGSRYGRRCRW